MNRGRVFLVDDDAGSLKAMSRLLRVTGFDVLAFASAHDFLTHHNIDTPGCAVLDVMLGDDNGIDIYRRLLNQGHVRPTIFITGKGDIQMGVGAMKSGAIDFLTKPLDEAALITAISEAIARDLRIRKEKTNFLALNERIEKLTPREREVLALVVAGLPNKLIAEELAISERTVKIHRGQVMRKMGARSLVHLVRMTEPYRSFVGGSAVH